MSGAGFAGWRFLGSDVEGAGPHVRGGHDFDAVADCMPLAVGLEQLPQVEANQFGFAHCLIAMVPSIP